MEQDSIRTAGFARARSAQNKATRRAQLLRSAKKAIQDVGLEAVNMDDVAGEADITKSAFYRYFSSKDELFAHVLLMEMDSITSGLAAKLPELDTFEGLADILASVCAAHPVGCALISSLSRTLDKNVAEQRLVEIKQGYASTLSAWSDIIAATNLPLDQSGAADLAKSTYSMIAGLWPLTQDKPQNRRAAEKAGFSATFDSFEVELAQHIARQARGIVAEKRDKKR